MSISSLELLPTLIAPYSGAMPVSDSPTIPRLDSRAVPLVIHGSGHRTVGIAELGMAWLGQFHSAPQLLFNSSKTWLKQDTDRRAALVNVNLGDIQVTWFLKETRSRSWRVRLAANLASCRSANAWHQGRALRALNISTPCPIAYATFTSHGVFQEYLLTEALPQAVGLSRWLALHPPRSDTPESQYQRRILTCELAAQLSRLHRHRFDHRDLKASNVLVTHAETGLRIWLIDLDGVWRWPVLPYARVVQNLARLWVGVALTHCVTPTDALRFLKMYLGREWRANWKSFWKSIVRRAAIKFAQISHRNNSNST